MSELRLWPDADSIVVAGGVWYERLKRLSDIVVACVLIVVLAPLMLLTCVLVKLTSRGPILFTQSRAGLNGAPFTMFKFRTMRRGAEEDRVFLAHLNEKGGPIFKISDDPRLTRIGRFLRRSSVDELPQLFHVLIGQMSLIGPRPLWLKEARRTTGAAAKRTLVKPGLTCLWQISGRSELSYAEWVSLDLFYISRRGFLLDVMILLQTIPAVVSAHGAY